MPESRFNSLYMGTIDEVWPPGHKQNYSKYQYEYLVRISMPCRGQLPARCIKNDPSCGSAVNYEDEILTTGNKVFVAFPEGDTSCGVILGGCRSYFSKQEPENVHYHKSFNLVDIEIDNSGNYSIQTREFPNMPVGPNILITKHSIKIGDNLAVPALEDSIEIDRMAQKMTIKCGSWEIIARQGVDLKVVGDVNITCKSANVTALGNVDVKAKEISATALTGINVKSAVKVDVMSPQISFNGGVGRVLTTATQPVCYVTGIPFIGSPTFGSG